MDDKHKQLMCHCIELLNTYDGDKKNVEEHMDHYLQSNKMHDEDDEIFIKEVFLGCIHYNSILKVFTKGFFIKDGQNILRSNENSFLVLAYLALFRLDELGMAHFRKFVSVLDINTAYRLLSFMINEENILTWMKDGWNKIYEQAYIQTNLISPILRWLPELRDLVKLLKNRIDNKPKPKTISAPSSEAKPFSLTKPRIRTITIPDKVPKLLKAKPPPQSLYRSPAVEKQTEKTRKKAEEHLKEASKLQFACANFEKSDKTKQVIQSMIFEECIKVDAKKIKVRSAPDFKKNHLPVKMTSAALLREGMVYQKQENEIIEKLRKLEAGALDATDFYKWQSEKKLQDLEKNLSTLEERRLMGKLSHEEAILARTNLIAENQVKVQSMKKEAATMVREYLVQKFEREKDMKILVENTMAGHKNAENAKNYLKEYKQRLVQEVKDESKDLMRQALEEAESELRSKIELIQQIRVMEKPTSHIKMLDLASIQSTGLMGEMSIVELQERLTILKAQKMEEEKIKRENIISMKQTKADYISETIDRITKHRAEQTKSAAYKFEQLKKNVCIGAPSRNDKLTELERKVQEKRAERLTKQQKMQFLSSETSSGRKTKVISQQVWDKFYQCDEQRVVRI